MDNSGSTDTENCVSVCPEVITNPTDLRFMENLQMPVSWFSTKMLKLPMSKIWGDCQGFIMIFKAIFFFSSIIFQGDVQTSLLLYSEAAYDKSSRRFSMKVCFLYFIYHFQSICSDFLSFLLKMSFSFLKWFLIMNCPKQKLCKTSWSDCLKWCIAYVLKHECWCWQ